MAFLGKITEQYSELWKAIIRPPRDIYEIKDLGPTVFSIENRTYQRTDSQLKNSRGQTLQCSHFEPIPSERVAERLPCVVYLHGNCSSRLEAVSTLPVLLPFNITVFCVDFSGCGLSDGEYLSLGYYERDDLAVVVNQLRESHRVTCIGLWGRSMGAVAALLHGDRDPSIAGMVLDSPFSDLKILCEELVDVYVNFKIPRWVVGIAIQMVRTSIKANANFDILDLAPIEHVRTSFIPALFTAAYNDTFVRSHHGKALHEAYAGDKNFVMVEGDHNSARSKFFMDSVAIFFFNTLQCDQLPHQQLPRQPIRSQSRSSARAPAGHDDVMAAASMFGGPSRPMGPPGGDDFPFGQGARGGPSPNAALGLHMRPPDRGGMGGGRYEEDDLQMNQAIAMSLQEQQGQGGPGASSSGNARV
eukprot:gnl/TRDRNA2_/TRDRNA2_171564_c1_seq1.p1 gnl/TRDRNA2_/TRDRNA2_171564_c1~~gnl/TRDRNA2_/TRDRNA2_171564_c1_seq1.p1  ORF type:complete len:415 (-),score=56.05 gnl/TRDRNA2_/TRDRNA2_171564_c1_seq1:91-1335(-)